MIAKNRNKETAKKLTFFMASPLVVNGANLHQKPGFVTRKMKKIALIGLMTVLTLSGCASYKKDADLYRNAFLNTKKENLALRQLLVTMHWDTIQMGKALRDDPRWVNSEKLNREEGARLDADIKEYELATGKKLAA